MMIYVQFFTNMCKITISYFTHSLQAFHRIKKSIAHLKETHKHIPCKAVN